ncbi:hypothetical protein A2115_01210 [Candidatus Woesebacteria bacterium GWA1_41_8]|jgi:hypothetical protein|uniref:Uncharacterized protein n=1 Tax=Candidatus Woesebacteria bacterium GWA1_41_8 TaxID=1802471 RepID=A0A1F7WIF2_9BACT|nr:MAG: hypothetical protein A2115_01210 [Candidatus Woesebacteria bacterium GWA1_41_8]
MTKLPKYFTKVTKTTKLLALTMFILLPLWSFYVGFKLGEGIALIKLISLLGGEGGASKMSTIVAKKTLQNATTVNLPVTILKTDFGTEASNFEYPKTLTVSVPGNYKDQLAAYGAAYEILVAPKGWTGSGSIGADGNTLVELNSWGGAWGTDSKMKLIIASTGTANALLGAAPYFQWVRENWNELSETPIPKKAEMTTAFVTSRLMKYKLLNPPEGLEVAGVVYSDAKDHVEDEFWSFIQMEITYPKTEQDFADQLLNTFIDQHGMTK